jgi:4-hydroxy-tetrahydrodipicolinate synthase
VPITRARDADARQARRTKGAEVAHGLHGALPALVTPLTPEGEVHDDDLARLVGRAIDDGANGVLVAGSTGEGALLEPEQRVRLTQIARRVIDAADVTRHGTDEATRPTLVAGASGATVAALHADVSRLADAGADLVLVLAPSTYPLGPHELVALHLDVAERAPVATLAYHIPQFTGSSLTPENLRQLAAHPHIVGVKDSSPDTDRRARFLQVVRTLDGFELMSGHAPSLQAALEAGASGSITAIANVRQRQLVALHAAVATRDQGTADRLQASLSSTATKLEGVGSSLPATLKAAMQLEGVITERWCRPPLHSVGPNRLDHVRTALLR